MKIIPAEGPDGVDTVMVTVKGNKNGPVRVNLSDFEADQASDNPTMKATDADPEPIPAPEPEQAPAAPPQFVVGRFGRSINYYVKNLDGTKTEGVKGIDEDGYPTEEAAWAAIKALSA